MLWTELDPVTLGLVVFATYYSAVTAAKLHGPLGVAERVRHAIFRWRGFQQTESGWRYVGAEPVPGAEHSDGPGLESDWIAAGASCPLCQSLYFAPIMLLLAMTPVGSAAIVVLAVAGASSALFKAGDWPF